MDNIYYRRQRFKGIVEKETEEDNKEQQQGDVEQYDTVPKIKLVYERIHIKNSK